MLKDTQDRLHPLFNKQCARAELDLGVIPNFTRGTGRTTALALRALATIIERPYIPVALHDHYDRPECHRALLDRVLEIAYFMRIGEHIKVDRFRYTVTLADRVKPEQATPACRPAPPPQYQPFPPLEMGA